MNMIVVDRLSSFIDTSSSSVSTVDEKYQKLRSASLELRRSIHHSELSFLTDYLSSEVNEVSKIVKKLKAYNNTLRGVLTSYQRMDRVVASAAQGVTPRNY